MAINQFKKIILANDFFPDKNYYGFKYKGKSQTDKFLILEYGLKILLDKSLGQEITVDQPLKINVHAFAYYMLVRCFQNLSNTAVSYFWLGQYINWNKNKMYKEDVFNVNPLHERLLTYLQNEISESNEITKVKVNDIPTSSSRVDEEPKGTLQNTSQKSATIIPISRLRGFMLPAANTNENSVKRHGYQFNLKKVAEDGNCLFHAFGCYEISKTHLELRQLAVDYLLTHLDDYADFVIGGKEALIKHLSQVNQPNVWADMLEIDALAKVLNRPVVIIYTGLNRKTTLLNIDARGEPVFLLYKLQLHYDALLLPAQFNSRKVLQIIMTQLDNNSSQIKLEINAIDYRVNTKELQEEDIQLQHAILASLLTANNSTATAIPVKKF